MLRKIISSTFLLSLALVCQSQAATMSFDYSGIGVSESFTITTGASVATYGDGAGYLITGITGQRNGVAITGLTQAANNPAFSPGYTTSSDGRWWFDNVLLVSGNFDLWGLLFSTTDGNEYNLYNNNGQYIDGYFNTKTGSYELTNVAKNVPENGMTLTLLGVTLIGLAAFRRQFIR